MQGCNQHLKVGGDQIFQKVRGDGRGRNCKSLRRSR